MGIVTGGLGADLPAALGAVGGAGEGCWGTIVGLLAGVSAADDMPLSKVNTPRPVSGAKGDGTGTKGSGSPASGKSQACCLPFLSAAMCLSAFCLMRKSKSSCCGNLCRSVLFVFGFMGIRLHPCFLDLHRAQGPTGSTLQALPAWMHRSHCPCLLTPSQLIGQ